MRERPCILIVDDHRPTADSLKLVLKAKHPNWDFHTAYSVKDAIDFIKRTQLDAVISDFKLNENNSKENGFVVVEAARRKDSACVTLLITAYPGDFERYQKAYQTGIYDCIFKNSERGIIVANEISVKMKHALEQRWAHEEAYHYARHVDEQIRGVLKATSKETKLNSRWLTMMFADVRCFSDLSRALRKQNHLVASFLEMQYTMIVEIAHRHHGVVDKFMGDGALLLFGVFDSDGSAKNHSHAQHAVRAALELQTRCGLYYQEFRKLVREQHGIKIGDLALGVGINTDEVLVGIIRTESRDQFTAVGHGVNMAQRLESRAGKTNQSGYSYEKVLVSDSVKSRLEGNFSVKQEPQCEDLMEQDAVGSQIWGVQATWAT